MSIQYRLLAAMSLAAQPATSASDLPKPSLGLLAERLTGSFSSADQAAADPENYFEIVLHMTPIFAERRDGPWLYVEQATAKTPDKPYRQRVYRLSEPRPGVFKSDVYTLPDPAAAIGAWRDASRLGDLKPESLTLRDGCALTLTWKPGEGGAPGAFVGSTTGTQCASELRGGKYATSEATILPDRLITWDRGYNEKGEQVWGATKGGYEFRRIDDEDIKPPAAPAAPAAPPPAPSPK